MKRPLFNFALAWCCGIVLADMLPGISYLPILFLLAIMIFAGFYHRKSLPQHPTLNLFICLLMIPLGQFWTTQTNQKWDQILFQVNQMKVPSPTVLEGQIKTPFHPSQQRYQALLDHPILWNGHRWCQLPGKVVVYAQEDDLVPCTAGQILRVTGTWQALSPVVLAGKEYGLEWNKRANIIGSIHPVIPPCMESRDPRQWSLMARLDRRRSDWQIHFENLLNKHFPGDSAALVSAMTTGNRDNLSPQLEAALIYSGLMHLTAISGLHISVLLVGLPLLLKPFGVRRRQRAMLGIILSILLVWIIGDRAPVIRAAIMGICLMLGLLFDRDSDALNLLGLAGLILLVIHPNDLWQPGFQLSFLIVAALILWTPRSLPARVDQWMINQPLFTLLPTSVLFRFLSGCLSYLLGAFLCSTVACIASIPVSLWNFHLLPLNAIGANLIGIPLSLLLTTLGMILFLGSSLPSFFLGVILIPLGWISSGLMWWIEWTSTWPYTLNWFSRPAILLVLAPIVFGILYRLPEQWFGLNWNSRRNWALVYLLLMSWIQNPFGSQWMQAVFLNIGQGDATLLRFPSGQTLLVDAGPETITNLQQLSPMGKALLDMGIDQINGVVLTHNEADHYGGLVRLTDELQIGTFFWNGQMSPSPKFKSLLAKIQNKGIRLETLTAGEKLLGISDATVTCLHPSQIDLKTGQLSSNDLSIVLRVETMEKKILFCGDIGTQAEDNLLEENPILQADILKVAHHGSKYSSSDEFLKAVNPSLAIIHVGKNTFGHPTTETLQRLTAAGSQVYLTQRNGNIHLEWKDSRFFLSCFSHDSNQWSWTPASPSW